MSQDLWPFYDRELRFLRELAVDFSRKYPREAGYLGLEDAGRSNDPHVERLIEAVALLSAKVRLKIDDDFPELTDSLFSILYPHYLAPLPSMTILELLPNPGASDLGDGMKIPRHSRFQARAMVEAVEGRETIQCEYRSCYPVTLWPIVLSDAKLVSPPLPDDKPDDAMCMLRFRFEAAGPQNLLDSALGKPGADGNVPGIRLYLSGDGPLTSALYEVLFNNALAVEFRSLTGPESIRLDPQEVLKPSGFATDEGILPYPDTAFMGYRLLTEFFAFREKFLFFELHGWDKARTAKALGRDGVEVLIYFNREANPDYERAVKASTFRLGCTPAVNLFDKTTDGFTLTQKKYDYPVVPDRHNLSGHEVYSLDVVYHRNPSTGAEMKYEPFYSYRHADRDKNRRYWYASRKASLWKDDSGTEVDLHFVDLDFDPNLPAEGIILAKTTCLSRDIPSKFKTAQSTLRFEPISALPVTVKWLRAPTPTRRPKLGRGAYWRLVSHLSLNHLSIAEGSSGRAALQEYLSLYDFADPEQAPELATIGQKVRDGIISVSSKRDVAFIEGDMGGGYARGMAIKLELNEDNYIGVGAYLFASVIERFYALYASLNSFTRLTLATKQRNEIKRWPARAGDRVLV